MTALCHPDEGRISRRSGSQPASTSLLPIAHCPLPTTDILGVHIHAVDMPTAVAAIEDIIAARRREFVTLCNVHMLAEADDEPAFRDVLARAALRLPDGMPLVWLARRAGQPQTQRVRGADLVDALCARSAETGHRHYFYGGGPGVAQDMAARLADRHPGLQVAGAATPGRLAARQPDDPAALAAIDATKPNILWVGLGCPKQEWWSALHRDHLDVPVIIAVGAAFDFHSGAADQAPLWMQRHGLEWIHRLVQDPFRLAPRYVAANTRFAMGSFAGRRSSAAPSRFR
jgi:N-acetylglucosaminyldiphosphoundecaprenol N-acetyl-beta-D-mannosaminyltransferase